MSVIPRFLTRADGSSPSEVAIEPMRRKHLRHVMPLEFGAYPKSW